ncbi:MAG: GerMN domain-containing protein [Spirochaetaceae bacterium]|jgi:spore germination protein GerM|nr:GerMN domain-containing protein [Spirochaetaceae bacterium]
MRTVDPKTYSPYHLCVAERNNSGRNTPRSRKKTGKKPVWLIFWLLFFIVVLCLFVVNWENIRNNIRKTGVKERLFNQPTAEQQNPEPIPETPAPDAVQPPADNQTAADSGVSGDVPGTYDAVETEDQPGPAGTPLEPATSLPSTGQPATGQLPITQPAANQPATGQPTGSSGEAVRRERGLYFVQVDRDGSILRTRVTRSLAVSDSPMLDVLQALLQGPSAEEREQGLISLIPPETRIISRTTTVRGNTAYINFSEDFMFNTYGVEGYAAQLRQIVWTVTEFSNVKDVQILIEGRRVDYLGEGIWIGSPIGKDTL